MSTTSEKVDEPATSSADQIAPRGIRRVSLAALVLASLLSAAVAGTAGIALTSFDRHPGDESTEAGFARDMQVHHAQAVEMATIVRDRTDDTVIRTIAYDILTSQQQQMGQMYAWLRSWGLPQRGNQPAMAWMSKGMDHSDMNADEMKSMMLLPDGRMPGMASPEELQELRKLRGIEEERLFLKLMITHHRAGVAMAKSAKERSKNKQVDELASAIIKSQTAEIDAMTDLLNARVKGGVS